MYSFILISQSLIFKHHLIFKTPSFPNALSYSRHLLLLCVPEFSTRPRYMLLFPSMLYCSLNIYYFLLNAIWICSMLWLFNICVLLLHLYFLNLFILFIYFWLCWVFVAARELSLVVASRGYSLLRCTGFSLRWLLLLWSTGSRRMGFSSCGTWVQ